VRGNRCVAGMLGMLLVSVSVAEAQDARGENSPTSPPKIVLLVYRKIQFGKVSERQKLEAGMSRACDRLPVPNSWIDLESVTGAQEAVSFDPMDSFEQMDKAVTIWGQIYATHLELARMQQQIDATVSSERTVITVRRDDLGYSANSIDLSKARFLRVLEVRLQPGRERDFVEAFKILSAAYEKIDSDTPWVVYQVNAGMPSPSFLIFVPMNALRQNDDLLARQRSLREAEGEQATERMQEIAREAYASTESNLYYISPGMSHVSKEFAEGDPDFWTPKRQGSTRTEESTPATKRPAPKSGAANPQR
jgi:hypothetical protein